MTAQEAPSAQELADIASQLGRLSRENKLMFEQLLEGERRYRRLARAVWQGQEEERRRLSRDLHDGLGQSLTALKNQLRRQHLATEAAGGEPSLHLATALEIADQALTDTRELSRLLCPPVLEQLGLEAALRWLVRILGERGDLDVDLDWQVANLAKDMALDTLVFRLVQEALTNVVRHAGVAAAAVELRRSGDTLLLAVSDAGAGFDPVLALRSVDSSGLRGLHDRAALFGGSLKVHSRPGQGTRLVFRLPIPDPDPDPVAQGDVHD